MVRDQIALVYALGYRKVDMIVGHDQGQLMASYAAIIRPDMFSGSRRVANAAATPPSFAWLPKTRSEVAEDEV
jgi:pimeloyl-ACP methyl ester carboxylesterase